MTKKQPRIPEAPRSIQKGVPLKHLLGAEAVECLAFNIRLAHPDFDGKGFKKLAINGLEPLELMPRARHLAAALRACLPSEYGKAVRILIDSMAKVESGDQGLAVFFYLPHSFFISEYGLEAAGNGGKDPFAVSMKALHALTLRFTSEFAIRPFLIHQQERTLAQVMKWIDDPSPDVRRLCSEGARPRLPWGVRLPAFIKDPRPALPILEALKNDDSLYVRRSVANHLGDIAKDHPEWVVKTCYQWLRKDDSKEMKWVIRHAVRYVTKKGHAGAIALRLAAK